MIIKKELLVFMFAFLLELQVKANVVTTQVRAIPKHQYGGSLNLLRFQQVNDETNVVVDDKALDRIFLHPEVKDSKVVVVSVIGAFRKGKSFFMNYCLRFMYANYKSVNFMSNPMNDTANWMGAADVPLTGFSWRSGGTRDTTGIIIWSDVFLATNEIGEKYSIVLMDTQGLFDSETSPADNSRIFALGTLISSVQIFNLNGVIEENQLQYLQLATDFAKLAANDNQQTITTKPFQKLLFLIRDWSYPDDYAYGFTGGNSYLMKNLEIKENQHKSLKSVREYIFSSFENISCCLLPAPGKFVTKVIYDGSWSKMDEDFKDELKILIETLLHPQNLVNKKINNHELTAAELKNYIEVYFQVFQSNELVGAQSLYEITVTEQMNFLIQKGLQTYKEHFFQEDHHDNQLNQMVHNVAKMIAIGQFFKAQKMGSTRQHLKFQNQLDNKIEQTFSEWKIDAKIRNEKLAIAIREKKEKEEKNKRLQQEQLEAYYEHQIKMMEIERKNQALAEQQTAQVNEINRQIQRQRYEQIRQREEMAEEIERRHRKPLFNFEFWKW